MKFPGMIKSITGMILTLLQRVVICRVSHETFAAILSSEKPNKLENANYELLTKCMHPRNLEVELVKLRASWEILTCQRVNVFSFTSADRGFLEGPEPIGLSESVY